MTRFEREKELRKLYKDYYFNDFIEEDSDFCYEIGYLDAYSIGDEVIFSDFY